MKYFLMLCLFLITLPLRVMAFELFPMVQFLDDMGTHSTTFFKITNTSLVPLPIEILTVKRNVKTNNDESLSDTDDFFVFPPQVLIPPGKSQMVKVQYIGEPKTHAESYRLMVSQLPLKGKSDEDSVQMLFRIGALVFISPPSVEDNYSSKIVINEKSEPNLEIKNLGTSVIALNQHQYSVDWQGNKKKWDWDELESLLPMQYLVPNQSVKISAEKLLDK